MVHPTVVSVLLSASVERFYVSHMRDFLTVRTVVTVTAIIVTVVILTVLLVTVVIVTAVIVTYFGKYNLTH